jgi:hypothetical protein
LFGDGGYDPRLHSRTDLEELSSHPYFHRKKIFIFDSANKTITVRIPFTDKIDILDLNGMIKVMDFIFNFILKIKN